MNLKRTLWAAGAICSISAASAQGAAPNIIFILTDDQGFGDMGVFYQKQREAGDPADLPFELTPNLDKFAAEGARLPNHYCAAPVCAPSRASILAGVSQGHANVRDNQFDKALEDNHNLANVLKQAGYATVAVGKWGLQGGGNGRNSPHAWPAFPTKRGFDYFFGYARHVDGHEHYPKESLYTEQHRSKQVWDETTNVTPGLDKCYTADLWTAWAKHWIVEHQHTNSAQPFFMYLAYDTPHAVQEIPTQAYPAGGGLSGGMQWLGAPGHMINTASGQPDSWFQPEYAHATYGGKPWPDVYKRYATAIGRIDCAVGDVVKLLKDLGIDDNTLVVFTSDNGPSIESYIAHEPLRADFFDSFGPFDGIKRDCWEGGERVPTLARWPGHIALGSVVARPSISYEWLRTFAEAAGLPAPARADGASLLPDLLGHPAPKEGPPVYVEYFENGRTPNYAVFTPAHRNRKRGQMQLVRLGDYVGVRYNVLTEDDPFELYNIGLDPREATNLAAAMPALERRIQAVTLQSRRPNASAPRPYDNELMPAVAREAAGNGIEWKAYEGDYPWVPDLATLAPAASGTADLPDLGKRTRDNDIGMFFTGYLDIPRDGDYTFYLTADTGALLRIHDATVIDADYGYIGGQERSGNVRLQKGLHPFRLYYARRKTGHPSLSFSWSGPGLEREAVPATAFRL